jgi:hypothetical protein
VGIRCADHATPSPRKKLAPSSPKCGGRSVGIVRLRAKTTEFFFFVKYCSYILYHAIKGYDNGKVKLNA